MGLDEKKFFGDGGNSISKDTSVDIKCVLVIQVDKPAFYTFRSI